MNKVILMGRLAKDPEMRYGSGAEPLAIARYTIAVRRSFRREGEADADFVNCVAFGKGAEFLEKYFKKGMMISVVGRLSVRSYEDKSGDRRWSTEVVTEEHHFAESRSSFESRQDAGMGAAPGDSYGGQGRSSIPQRNTPSPSYNELPPGGFSAISESLDSDDDIPF